MKQRILIFQDGAKFKSPPEKWRLVNVLTHALIRLIQEPGFEYVVIDPAICAEKLQSKIKPNDFSCAIDLSGLFGSNLRREGILTFDDFRLSRLRRVSSPLLDGVGFRVSVSAERVAKIREEINQITSEDSRQILILDDVGWSGRTIRQTTTMLGLQPNSTTVGFLAGNRGNFGGSKTEVEKLEEEGFQIVTGEDVFTPADDGFHLADFLIGSDTNFDPVTEIQSLREAVPQPFEDSEAKRKDSMHRIQQILEENQEILFPKSFSSNEAKRMAQDGEIIVRGGISSNSFFDINPPNWLMPSFSNRITSSTLIRNRKDIIDVTSELQEVLEFSREDKELHREITEGRGKERL